MASGCCKDDGKDVSDAETLFQTISHAGVSPPPLSFSGVCLPPQPTQSNVMGRPRMCAVAARAAPISIDVIAAHVISSMWAAGLALDAGIAV